jgi:GDP-4-dehydro-6-deoxy-D-mannose reductase
LREQRDYLDVRDAVDAYETLLRAGEAGCTYAVESGLMRSIGEIKTKFERLSSVRLAWEIGDAGSPSPEPRDSEAIRALGWKPRIPFERSLQEALDEERTFAGVGRKEGTAG